MGAAVGRGSASAILHVESVLTRRKCETGLDIDDHHRWQRWRWSAATTMCARRDREIDSVWRGSPRRGHSSVLVAASGNAHGGKRRLVASGSVRRHGCRRMCTHRAASSSEREDGLCRRPWCAGSGVASSSVVERKRASKDAQVVPRRNSHGARCVAQVLLEAGLQLARFARANGCRQMDRGRVAGHAPPDIRLVDAHESS